MVVGHKFSNNDKNATYMFTTYTFSDNVIIYPINN